MQETAVRGGVARWAWFGCGWLAVALGGLGIVVPGLPTTVFFIVAAACFSRSSPRFERWVLELPTIGPMVRDHRDGLGMPRRAKVAAIATIAVVSLASAFLAIGSTPVRALVLGLAAVGIAYIALRVPTRERVLAARTAAAAAR